MPKPYVHKLKAVVLCPKLRKQIGIVVPQTLRAQAKADFGCPKLREHIEVLFAKNLTYTSYNLFLAALSCESESG